MKKKYLTIVGSGGHARMIIECSIILGYEVKFIVDANSNSFSKEEILGISVKPKNYLKKINKSTNIFFAIGDNFEREKFFNKYNNYFNFIN